VNPRWVKPLVPQGSVEVQIPGMRRCVRIKEADIGKRRVIFGGKTYIY
jgi:hypothetical protein